MTNVILTIVLTLLAIEIAFRCRWQYRLAMMAHFAVNTRKVLFNSTVSDIRKEKLISGYALRFGTSAMMILIYNVLMLIPFALFLVASSNGSAYLAFLVSPLAIAIMFGTSLIYFFIRKRLGAKQ